MDFQDENRTTYEMKPEYFNQNLSKKSRINQDLLFSSNFLNSYEIFQLFQRKRNGIENMDINNTFDF